MTGSSNITASPSLPHAASPSLPHAASPQWLELSAAAAVEGGFSAQPHAWWSAQAKELREKWLLSGLPTTRLESWKYTSLVHLHGEARKIQQFAPAVTVSNELRGPHEPIRTRRLSELSEDRDAATLKIVRDVLTSQRDGAIFFESMAKSLVDDPLITVIPKNFNSEQPIEVRWPEAKSGQWCFGIFVLIVEANAQVSLVEKYGSGQGAATPVSFLSIAENAHVQHLRLQEGESSVVLSSSKTLVDEAAGYETAQVAFGSELSREDLTVELLGPSARATTDGVFIGRGRQVLDHHTSLVHRVGNTVSAQVYKGLLSDESRGVFNGRIAISKNASGSDSSQMNRNLLLSRKVEIDTKPQLEIDNDDVKAAHGAAIGRLDSEHVFYLKSRGISQSEAVEILSRGFAFEAIERLSSLPLRDLGARSIERGLRGLSWESL